MSNIELDKDSYIYEKNLLVKFNGDKDRANLALDELKNALSDAKENYVEIDKEYPDDTYESLNINQKFAFDLVREHYEGRLLDENGNPKEQLLGVVAGKAGTGKSKLIRAMKSYLKKELVLGS